MPEQATARFGFIAPSGTDAISLGDDQIRAIVALIEAKSTIYEIGSGALPAAGVAGRLRYQTDTGVTYFDNGTKWRVAGGHVGQITMTARTTAPYGFLLAVGQAVTTIHPELRAALIADGSPYGVDGSGNPLLPNTPGRAIMGSGHGSGLVARAAGVTVGSETHNHPFVIPEHTHAGVDHLHSAGSLFAANHAHDAGTLYSEGGNRGTASHPSLSGSGEGVLYVNHVSDVQGNTGGSGNVGVGGMTGAADRDLRTGGASQRNGTTEPGSNYQPTVALNLLVQAL